MKKYFIGLLLFTVSVASYSQSIFSTALGGGLDYNYNEYYNEYTYSKYLLSKHYNLDLDGALMLGKKFRLQLEMKYMKFGYGQRYNPVGQQSSNTLIKSEITFQYWSMTPRVNYKLTTFKKFDLYASAGFKFEFNIDGKEESETAGGRVYSSHHLDDNYTVNMQGIAGGLLLKYNITKHLSVNLVPDYTYYMQKFYSQNQGNFQRFSADLSVEWRY